MPLVAPIGDHAGLAGVLAHRPELAERYDAFVAEFWKDERLPPRVLQLCRARIGQIHGCDGEIGELQAGDSIDEDDLAALASRELSRFAEPEQTALQLAELIPYGHHEITDAQVHSADEAFGHGGCVTLLTALAFFDVQCRLRLTWGMT